VTIRLKYTNWLAGHEPVLERDGVLLLPGSHSVPEQLIYFREIVRKAPPEYRGAVHAVRCFCGGVVLPLW
jgi:hypothetical protein